MTGTDTRTSCVKACKGSDLGGRVLMPSLPRGSPRMNPCLRHIRTTQYLCSVRTRVLTERGLGGCYQLLDPKEPVLRTTASMTRRTGAVRQPLPRPRHYTRSESKLMCCSRNWLVTRKLLHCFAIGQLHHRAVGEKCAEAGVVPTYTGFGKRRQAFGHAEHRTSQKPRTRQLKVQGASKGWNSTRDTDYG